MSTRKTIEISRTKVGRSCTAPIAAPSSPAIRRPEISSRGTIPAQKNSRIGPSRTRARSESRRAALTDRGPKTRPDLEAS